MATNQQKPLHIGVLILPPVQLLDISPIDLFGMLTPEYLTVCNLPAPLLALSVPINITYISPTGDSPALCTANVGIRIDASIASPDVAPGKLDILLIPGPEPSAVPAAPALEFVRGHVENGADLLNVCTGQLVAAYAGVLDGRVATGPRGLLGRLRGEFREVKWVERRWARDGGVWTSGGVTNGQDMVAAYIRQRWPGPLAEVVCRLADVGDRGVEYEIGAVRENGFWLWQILRAGIAGLWKGKQA
ncbi:class I glutamine amidotransferase-like protein [Lophium mytilinum]|uniref:Class I glutamine amidotransferase-like protein n=1 Tax=Lophium mytilinum TaxID=390894 RepID=A0A6A6RDW9_9PEZI|nr:class I glutamine amidotransferase-like protein [Lophium mytilinum]